MRARQALRQQWSQEARREARARDPRLAAQDAAERAALDVRGRVLERYGRLVKVARAQGELSPNEAFDRIFDAQERTRVLLEARRRRIFGSSL